VYAMLIAVALFDNEKMSIEFYIGASIIMATILGNAFYKRRFSKTLKKT